MPQLGMWNAEAFKVCTVVVYSFQISDTATIFGALGGGLQLTSLLARAAKVNEIAQPVIEFTATGGERTVTDSSPWKIIVCNLIKIAAAAFDE